MHANWLLHSTRTTTEPIFRYPPATSTIHWAHLPITRIVKEIWISWAIDNAGSRSKATRHMNKTALVVYVNCGIFN